MGSLNVNGMRDGRKNRLLSEITHFEGYRCDFVTQRLTVIQVNEAEWGLWWEGEHILSHGVQFECWSGSTFFPYC